MINFIDLPKLPLNMSNFYKFKFFKILSNTYFIFFFFLIQSE